MSATYADIPREVMETLIVVIDAEALVAVDDYEFRARMKDCEVVLDDAHLQELVSRGWLELVDLPDGNGGENLHLNVTSAGNYHAERWFKRDTKKRKARR